MTDPAMNEPVSSADSPPTPALSSLTIPTDKRATGRRMFISALLLLLTGVSLLFPLTTPATTLFSADQQSTTPMTFVGHLIFSNSNQLDPISQHGINDIVTLDLKHLQSPTQIKALYAWLLPDIAHSDGPPQLLGKLSLDASGNAYMTYLAPEHQNLLAAFSRFLITEEPVTPSPIIPTLDQRLWRATGEIANIPVTGDGKSYSLLAYLRHLLAKEPTLADIGLSGGLAIWLYRNSQKLLEWGSAARDEWGNANTGLVRRQITRMIHYLDGITYTAKELPPNTPLLVDPKAGRLGLLNTMPNQQPPGYLAHISLHLAGVVNSPSVTDEQKNRAVKLDDAIHTLMGIMQQMRIDTLQLLRMSDTDLRQTQTLDLLNNLVANANTAYVGKNDPITGTSQGGVVWVYSQLQLLADISITTPRQT